LHSSTPICLISTASRIEQLYLLFGKPHHKTLAGSNSLLPQLHSFTFRGFMQKNQANFSFGNFTTTTGVHNHKTPIIKLALQYAKPTWIKKYTFFTFIRVTRENPLRRAFYVIP